MSVFIIDFLVGVFFPLNSTRFIKEFRSVTFGAIIMMILKFGYLLWHAVTWLIGTDVSKDGFAFILRNVGNIVTRQNIWIFKIKFWCHWICLFDLDFFFSFFVVKEICSQNRCLIFKERIKKKHVGEVCLAHDSVNTTINLRLRENKRREFHDYTVGTESGRALAASGSLPFA